MRCRMDGLLRPACCCPPEARRPRQPGPVVKAADCCNAEVAQSTRLPAEAVRAGGSRSGSAWPRSWRRRFRPSLSPIERLDRAWQRHGPAREGPPLVLLKHAFLI